MVHFSNDLAAVGHDHVALLLRFYGMMALQDASTTLPLHHRISSYTKSTFTTLLLHFSNVSVTALAYFTRAALPYSRCGYDTAVFMNFLQIFTTLLWVFKST